MCPLLEKGARYPEGACCPVLLAEPSTRTWPLPWPLRSTILLMLGAPREIDLRGVHLPVQSLLHLTERRLSSTDLLKPYHPAYHLPAAAG